MSQINSSQEKVQDFRNTSATFQRAVIKEDRIPKVKPIPPDLTWLEWKKGAKNAHLLSEGPTESNEDEREKIPVYLVVNNHAKEKLKKVLKKKTTAFQDYLGHGIVPLVKYTGDDDAFKEIVRKQYEGEKKPIRPGTVEEKIWANAADTTWRDRRNLEWSRHNWRPAEDWEKLERARELHDARKNILCDKNRKVIYNDQYTEASTVGENKKELNWLQEVPDQNPSEPSLNSRDTAGQPKRAASARSSVYSQNSKNIPGAQKKNKELFTKDELRKLQQLPQYMQEKILKIRSGGNDQKSQVAQESNKENQQELDNRQVMQQRVRRQDKKKEEGELRMIKYWDGYVNKYSPVRLKYEEVGAQPSPERDQEKLRQLALMQQDLQARAEMAARPYDHDCLQGQVPGLVHHARQDGYFNAWFDATNCDHHPAVRPTGERVMVEQRVDPTMLNYDRR